MNKCLIASLSVIICILTGCSKTWDVIVRNDADFNRNEEMIEIDLADLYVDNLDSMSYVVYDMSGNEIPSQVTYDNKLIFQVSVAANSKVNYKISIGSPSEYQTYAVGRVYPERVDDLAWENDLIAFRVYGPALQRSGEKAYGNDVWVKNNTPFPVVEKRYSTELNPETRAKIVELEKNNNLAEAKKIADSVSYHINHGNGYDAYSVGPTLGAGRTALYINDNIIYPYCYTDCVILDNGPLRFTASLKYEIMDVDSLKVRENRRISIDKGNFLNHEVVWYEGLIGDHDVISGIINHEPDGGQNYTSTEANYISHVDAMAQDSEETYIAVLFRSPFDCSVMKENHLSVINKLDGPEPLDYYWGAAWNKSSQISDYQNWNSYLDSFANCLKNPLIVEVR